MSKDSAWDRVKSQKEWMQVSKERKPSGGERTAPTLHPRTVSEVSPAGSPVTAGSGAGQPASKGEILSPYLLCSSPAAAMAKSQPGMENQVIYGFVLFIIIWYDLLFFQIFHTFANLEG